MAEINLLPHDVRAIEKKTKQGKEIKLLAIGLLVVSVIVSSVFLGLWIVTKQSAEATTTAATRIETELTTSQSKIDSALVLVAKLGELNTLLKSSPRYTLLLTALSQKIPADVNIKELSVVSPTKVNLSGDSSGYQSLAQFLKVLTSDSTSIFSGETLQSVVLDNQTGRVQFVLLVTVKDGSLIT